MQFFEFLFSHIKQTPKQYVLPIGIGCVGLILFVYGLVNYFGHSIPEKDTSEVPLTTTMPVKIVKKIMVDVEGAVEKAGVYSIAYHSRMQDAVLAAGGLSPNADRGYVQKRINLAAKLTDGAKIYIPQIGENQVLGVSTDTQNISVDSSGLVNINEASADAIDALPGVGPSTVQKIIKGRPYAYIQELLTKKIISQKVFTKVDPSVNTIKR